MEDELDFGFLDYDAILGRASHKRMASKSPSSIDPENVSRDRIRRAVAVIKSPRFGVADIGLGFCPPPPIETLNAHHTSGRVDTPHAKKQEILERLGSILGGKSVRTPKPARKAAIQSVKWSPEEDETLRQIVFMHGARNWRMIAELHGNQRTDVQCQHRWNKVLKPGLHKGPWTDEEDAMLRQLIEEMGGIERARWSEIAQRLPGRLGKQCRERWFNHLDPSINREEWTAEEDRILSEAHDVFGNRWKEIAKLLPGRTESSTKNRYNSAAFRKRMRDGVLPEPSPRRPQQAAHRPPAIDTTLVATPRAENPTAMVIDRALHGEGGGGGSLPLPPALRPNNSSFTAASTFSGSGSTMTGSVTGGTDELYHKPHDEERPEMGSSSSTWQEEVPLSMLPYFRILNRDAQRALMRQLIDGEQVALKQEECDAGLQPHPGSERWSQHEQQPPAATTDWMEARFTAPPPPPHSLLMPTAKSWFPSAPAGQDNSRGAGRGATSSEQPCEAALLQGQRPTNHVASSSFSSSFSLSLSSSLLCNDKEEHDLESLLAAVSPRFAGPSDGFGVIPHLRSLRH